MKKMLAYTKTCLLAVMLCASFNFTQAAVNTDPFGFNAKKQQPEMTEEERIEQQIAAILKQFVPVVSFALEIAQDEFFAMTDALSKGNAQWSVLHTLVSTVVEKEVAYRSKATALTSAQKVQCDQVLDALFTSFEKDELAQESLKIYAQNIGQIYAYYVEKNSSHAPLTAATWNNFLAKYNKVTDMTFEKMPADDQLTVVIMNEIIKESALVFAEFAALPQVQKIIGQ